MPYKLGVLNTRLH